MACTSCQQNKERLANQTRSIPRVIVQESNPQPIIENIQVQPATPKFLVPKVLPPLK